MAWLSAGHTGGVNLSNLQPISFVPDDTEWQRIKEIAAYAIKSGLLPSSIKSAEQATIIALKGRELGLPPMVALSEIYVVNGRPCCSANLMLAKILERYPKASIEYVQMDSKACRIKVKRFPDQPETEIGFTWDEAKTAGLSNKDTWIKWPADMLRARAITRMKRAIFADVLTGVNYTPEEMEEDRGKGQPSSVHSAKNETLNIRTIREVKNFAPQTQEEAEARAVRGGAENIDGSQEDTVSLSPEHRQARLKEIVAEKKRLGWSNDDLASYAFSLFQKESRTLNDRELEQLVASLRELSK
jgi:hypothetical protein